LDQEKSGNPVVEVEENNKNFKTSPWFVGVGVGVVPPDEEHGVDVVVDVDVGVEPEADGGQAADHLQEQFPAPAPDQETIISGKRSLREKE
jgi:hypothetical protein